MDLPDVLDSETIIDGIAYSYNDGTSLRDDKCWFSGNRWQCGGGQPGLADPRPTRVRNRDGNNRNIGLDLQAANATVRNLAVYGFGDAQNNDGEANIRVGEFNGTVIEACVIGASAGSFTAPAEVDTADNIRVVKGR